jgi:ribosome maturation factor RimP
MELNATLEKLIAPILADFALELVDLELKGRVGQQVLRVFIDKPGGVTLDDCAEVSREIDALLEVEDPIPKGYVLEVSSPGLDRPLKSVRDFQRNVGKSLEIKIKKPVDTDGRGKKHDTLVGELLGIEYEQISLRPTGKSGGVVTFALAEIAKANLKY